MTASRTLAARTIAAALTLAAGTAQAQLVSFDTFSGTTIAPARWSGQEVSQYGAQRGEIVRNLAAGQLHLESRAWSDGSANAGFGTVQNRLVAVRSDDITDLRATFTMRTLTMGACAANTTDFSQGRARLLGFFFNAGTPVPGSSYNDIGAQITIGRASNTTDATGVLRVNASLFRCTDDACISTVSLGFRDLGTASFNTPVELEVGWEPDSNRFRFQRDAQAVQYLTYTVSDSGASQIGSKFVGVQSQVMNCTTRIGTYVSADIDNVKTNALPVVSLARRAESRRAPTSRWDPITPDEALIGGVN